MVKRWHTMSEYKTGDIIQVIVVGSQHYGLFVHPICDLEVTGLIHISEISHGFVKNVNQIAKVNDILTAKILSYDNERKHLKLSMKACVERNRYQSIAPVSKISKEKGNYLKDFSTLSLKLNEWIEKELEKEEVEL